MNQKFFVRKKPAVSYRGIHLDLKGLPPSSGRLLSLVSLLREARINCLLVEWEDMYPWSSYPFLRNETAYTRKTVECFLEKARQAGIEVIPLVQSFGHLENVLSRKPFRKLREIPSLVSDLCPSRPAAQEVILNLVKDILETHGSLKYFHLGGDEVWSFGRCRSCRKKVAQSGKAALYLAHLEPIFHFLDQQGIRPIIWDDMVRDWPGAKLKTLAHQTDLMCWNYAADPFQRLKRDTLERFVKAGCRLWAASAFKGADGPYADRPNLPVRLANMAAWVQQASEMKMVGVIATGWSRYNTFVSPCESLEVSLDSLVLSAKIAWEGKVPDQPASWAEKFLGFCQRKGLPVKSFFPCRLAAENLQCCREKVFQEVKSYLHQAHLVGEPERINPFRIKQAKQILKDSLEKVEKLAREWQKSHQGQVPAIWLEKYFLSRTEPVRRLVDFILAAH
ncbi:MAG: family 20 glycosylhydrolase [Candidatus Omnitrophica bacterium]|nr:family 20 glycosylhydrolase [Candidatus Omnitrophota bacterium]